MKNEGIFMDGKHLEIRWMLEFLSGGGLQGHLRRRAENALRRESGTALADRSEFTDAVRYVLEKYMQHNDQIHIIHLLQGLDSRSFDTDPQISSANLARYRHALCSEFASAITRLPIVRQPERPLVDFLVETLSTMMRNLVHIDEPIWNTTIRRHCKLAFLRLNIEAPDELYSALQTQRRPSGETSERPTDERRRPATLEAQVTEADPGQGNPPKLRCVAESSSSSGSETHPGLKKGTGDPFLGEPIYPKELKDSRTPCATGNVKSGQSAAMESNEEEKDEPKPGSSGLGESSGLEAPRQKAATKSKAKDSKKTRKQQKDSESND